MRNLMKNIMKTGILFMLIALFFISSETVARAESIIEFGEYPQTLINNETLNTTLNKLKTPDSNIVKYEGEKYLYTDRGIFYKYEPISWIKIGGNDSKAVLISKYVLDNHTYGTINDMCVSWDKSDLRNWCNSDFLNNAFTNAEQKCMYLSAASSCDWGKESSIQTNEKVTIPSHEMVKSLSETLRQGIGTDYSGVGQHNYHTRCTGSYFGVWNYPIWVTSDGDYNSSYPSNWSRGIRPCIVLNIPAAKIVEQQKNDEKQKEKIKDISHAKISLSDTTYKYTGKSKTPFVTVKYGMGILKKNTDYIVSYANNIYVGTATVTITGKGRYIGSVRKKFSIISPGKVAVKLNPNGGTINKKAVSLSKGSVYGNLPKPTLKGNIFKGWYTAKNGGRLINSSSHVTNATTLYARWSKAKYKIVYKLNGGKNSKKNPASYTYNEKKITFESPMRRGYIFDGWYSDSGFNKKVAVITKGSIGDRILYAKWAPYTYTISFDGNLSVLTTQMMPMTIKYGMDYKIKANTYKATSGYKFAGWSLKQKGEVVFKDQENISINSLVEKGYKLKDGTKIKLWAQWKRRNYKITYNLNGGINPSKVPVTFSAVESISLPIPKRTGYNFRGWYSENKKISVIPLGTIRNISVTAKWEAITYSIDFNANGGTGKTGSMNCKYDKEYTIRDNGFTKDNYNFISWNTKPDGTGITYNAGDKIKNLASSSTTITLYAQWKRRELVIYKYKENVSKGSIRYVYQLVKNVSEFAKYNGNLAWGKWSSVAGGECGYATQSMALSYLGKDVSPEYLVEGERTKKWSGTGYTNHFLYGISGITAEYSPSYKGIDGFLTRFENDKCEGKYSPVIVHYSGNGKQHTILLIRKILNYQYEMIDTAKGIGKQIVTITQEGKVTGTGVTHAGGVVNAVEQYILLG